MAMKRRILMIVLLIWAVLATFLLVMASIAYNENEADWVVKLEEYNSIAEDYKELLAKEQEEISKDIRLIGTRAVAQCVTEKSLVCELSEETMLVVLFGENKTWRTMLDAIAEYAKEFKTMLELSEYTRQIIMVVDEKERVVFGCSFDLDGLVGDFYDEELIK